MTQANATPIAFHDGCPSDAAVRFDVAMSAAMFYAQAGDDVRVLSLAWDAFNAAREARDPEQLATALYLMQCAEKRMGVTAPELEVSSPQKQLA